MRYAPIVNHLVILMPSQSFTNRTLESTSGCSDADEAADPHAVQRAFFEHPRYSDMGPISRGGCGDVRRVLDKQSSHALAMKITRRCIDRASRTYTRFMTEIDIMTSLQHPGILPSFDHGEFDDGRLWLTMPEVHGQTLAQVLDELYMSDPGNRFRSRAFQRVLQALAQACSIVAAAHAQGFMHRDLKPKNIMVADDGETFVIDWGVAKRLTSTHEAAISKAELEARNAFTEQGEVLGTPAYMPPEQAFGNISAQSPACDVYSLGAILYHVLTGKPPYKGTGIAVLAQIRRAAPCSIESAGLSVEAAPPRQLVALCGAAMERDPSKRIGGAHQMAAEMRSWVNRMESGVS